MDRQKKATRHVNPAYTAWTQKREEVSLTQNQIKTTKSSLEAAEAAVKQAEDALDAASRQEPEVDRLRQTISRIDDEEKQYQQKEELKGKLKELKELDDTISAKEADLKEIEKALKEKIKALTETVKALKGKPAELTAAKNVSEKLTDLLADLDAVIDDQMPKREAKKKDLAKKQSTFLEIRDKYEEASGRREEAERILEESRAGILAEKLVEGEKCPVCGSVHHPEPAELKDVSISEADFKNFRKRKRSFAIKRTMQIRRQKKQRPRWKSSRSSLG